MAVNDPTYRYATQTWEADGVRTQYEIAFDGGYIRQSDVVAFSVLVDEDTGLTTDFTPHPLEFLNEDVDPETAWKTAQVEITPAVPSGRRVVIYRSTQKEAPLVTYTAGSVLTERNLDLANQQAIFGIAEIMDGLRDAGLAVNLTVEEVLDLSEIIRNIYEQVIELIEAGGIVSVEPRVWTWETDDGTRDYRMVGANVEHPGFYDTYLDGEGLNPDTDYTVVVDDEDPEERFLVLNFDPPDGGTLFTVLRGYARPYTGPPPATRMDIRTPIIDIPDVYFPGIEAEFATLRYEGEDDGEVFIRPTLGAGAPEEKLYTGSYFSMQQLDAGQIVVSPDTGAVTIQCPDDCLPRTRTTNSVITATCTDADLNLWVLSGDLAKA